MLLDLASGPQPHRDDEAVFKDNQRKHTASNQVLVRGKNDSEDDACR